MSLRWNMKHLHCLNIYKIQFPNYSIGTIKEFKCENTHCELRTQFTKSSLLYFLNYVVKAEP